MPSHPSGQPAEPGHRALLTALVLVSASSLLFEVQLTKLFANKLDHHFTFAIISVALLGLGSAGVWAQLRAGLLSPDAAEGRRRLSGYALGYALLVCASVVVFALLPLDPAIPGWKGAVALPVYFLVFAVVFFFGGVCVSALLVARGLRPSQVYFWDLLGAGAGALAGPAALAKLGGYGCSVAAGALGLGAAVALRWSVGDRPYRAAARATGVFAAAALLVALVPRTLRDAFGFDIVSFKAAQLKSEFLLGFGPPAQTYWNAVARVDVSPTGTSSELGFRYGLSRWLWGWPLRGRLILVDGGANTRQYVFDDLSHARGFLTTALWASPYVLRPASERVLVIGPGGGIDILVAKLSGAREVEALELNPDMYRLLLGRADDREAWPYSRWTRSDERTRVTIRNVEARHFARASRGSPPFDVVLASGVDTLTAIQSSGNALSENFLYTREAVEDWLALLAPGGILALTHWHLEPPALALKMFETYLEALEDAGVEHPERRVCVISEGFWENAIVKKGQDFTPEELDRLDRFAHQSGFQVVYRPYLGPNAPFVRAGDLWFRSVAGAGAGREARRAAVAQVPFDVTPATDDRPYFYWVRPARAGVIATDDGGWIFPQPSLRWMLVAALVACAALCVGPAFALARRGEPVRPAVRAVPVFAATGLGFILAENALFLLLTLFVGGPLYALSVVLPSLLVGYSVGSLVAGRMPAFGRGRAVALAAGYLAGFGLLALAAAKGLPAWIGLGALARTAIAVGIVTPFGALLGVAVPWCMEGLRERGGQAAALAWMWAVSASCNVAGSLLFVPACQALGARGVLALAAVLYAAAMVWAAFGLSVRRAESLLPGVASRGRRG
jgi:SAM-dependent methyltransferase